MSMTMTQGAGAPSTTTNVPATVALLRVGAAMDVGGRPQQEDALGIFMPAEAEPASRGSLFVLADGLGGHASGEVASRMAVEAIVGTYYGSPLRQPGNLLQSAIEQANRQIAAAGQRGEHRDMGSTCVCAAVQSDALWVANVGDSRGYLMRIPSGIQQLTQDHSMAAEQARLGHTGPLDPSLQSVLMQSLGMPAGVQPTLVGPLALQKGDVVLLCSDGLYNVLNPQAVQDYFWAALLSTTTVDPDRMAQDLVEGARFQGATDNISAVVIYCADVVPGSVAVAAGWPQQHARTLNLPARPASTTATPLPPEPAPEPWLLRGLPDPELLAALAAEVNELERRPVLHADAPETADALVERRRFFRARKSEAAPSEITTAYDAVEDRGLPIADPGDPIASAIAWMLPVAAGEPPATDRGLPGLPPGAPGDGDAVGGALTAALARSRQQWTFNLIMAVVSAGFVVGGLFLAGITWMLGQGELFPLLFGSGLSLLGVLSWMLTQPAAQLTRASSQISLLSIIWVSYAEELKSCARLADPAGTAACNERAAGQAVQYFNQVIDGMPK
ncbi:MAG TPA: protein phosphatase 2C domain-containing protein [Chloroflexia bacterium]|nr:protein phosphatase 2C domain-containing protein [Chloroflexia bacterium]